LFGINELILPLLGGYVFVTRWFVTRYVARQWSGYRLFFNSSIAGAFLFAISIVIVSVSKQVSSEARQFINLVFPSIYPYLDASVLAFALGSTLWAVFNLSQTNKESLVVKYAEESGGPLQVLLAKAFRETRQIAITLNSGKVYIGFVTKLNEIQDREEYVLIWPQFSGYRDSKTKTLKITTQYAPVYEQIMNEPERFSNISINDFQLVLPTSNLESISIFDSTVFSCFVNTEET
jgi:hypothetical protein